jgi:cytochrome c-type biogenesis protein CcmE
VTTSPPTVPPTTGSAPDAGPPPVHRIPNGAPKHMARYVMVGLVLVGALAFLFVKGLGSALNFYIPADQAVAQKTTLGEKTINLEGVVAPGSIHSTPDGVNFVVTSGAVHLVVHNTSSPPQLFQGNIPVIAVGHFQGDTFVSDQILVKHSSSYIARHPSRVMAPNGSKR